MDNIGMIFLSCFFALLQVIIYITIGAVSFLKKCCSSKIILNDKHERDMNVVNFSLGVYDALNFVRLMTDGLCCAKTLIRKWFHLKNNFNFDNILSTSASSIRRQIRRLYNRQAANLC